ncbi:MAG: hypothetical protein ACK2UK_04490 [Candidatus Promineifilaceae bacterium]|jgi:hypothetical protein
MAQQVIVLTVEQESIRADVERLPDQSDQFIILHNPRQMDGKRLSEIEEGVEIVLFPWCQIRFVQLLPDEEKSAPISFVRE